MINFDFYKNKKILITGHTGFKGSWLCKILQYLEAEVAGYALMPPTNPSLYEIAKMGSAVHSFIGDIRDKERLMNVFHKVQPEIVIHMAAQPLVRESYTEPVYTYETNVMGTVNVLECIRRIGTTRSFINVTTDKVYENKEWKRGYVETDRLDGFDPYSNSKSCAELVTHCYQQSFLAKQNVAVSTCRAGNVIGGGDFAKDRIIPDCLRAVRDNTAIILRNPLSVRPFQHVLEPLFAYLLIAMEQYKDIGRCGNYNIGPDERDCVTTEQLVSLFCEKWKENITWESKADIGVHEAGLLMLDSTKLKKEFGWKPKWHIDEAVNKVVEWEKAYQNSQSVSAVMENQIVEYIRKL